MSYKLEYISRLFHKTSGKRIEHYVITRIWHLLDNYDIKMTPQQYVSRQSSQYALTDVYFPQIGFHVEVNEPAHYESDERIQRDLKRINEIEANTGHRVFVIDCRESLDGIHGQIDNLISEINAKVNKQIEQKVFKPWNPGNEHNPKFWKDKGTISISDEVSFHTIEDICLLFDADYTQTKRGFLRKGGIYHPKHTNLFLWWPAEKPRSGWQNRYDEINGTITETHSDEEKKVNHYESLLQGTHIRVVFFHYKDISGQTNYKFVGVFKNNKEKSNTEIGTVWSRIGETLNLETDGF
jgi:hypothetical protein